MPLIPYSLLTCSPHKLCSGTCTGYGTCSNCPPLIVLAVIAASQSSPADSGAGTQGASR